MASFTPDHYYTQLAACFCRGRLALAPETSDDEALDLGERAQLRLFKWKRNADLPRVRRVLGVLRGFAPESLLDVGSGRGTFLWPLLDDFSELQVTAIDTDAQRADDLASVTRGGLSRLTAQRMDARVLSFEPASFDGVTALEVLEHMPDPERAVAECVRVARRFVVISVPAHEDDNPEHLHVLSAAMLEPMFTRTGVHRVRFDYVHNHLIAIATR
jgi:ubiquinone/menaquinone biosynthesis C-methylase UbiE